MDNNVTPLLIVKAPVGKMTTDRAMAYMNKLRDNIKQATTNEYNLIVVPSRSEEFIFECGFSPTDEVEKVLNNEEIKEIIKGYLKETENDN